MNTEVLSHLHSSVEPLLDIQGLEVVFNLPSGPVNAVRGIDLSVGRGRVTGLVGESGSGKSVTARAVMNLLRPPGRVTSGTISFEGEDLHTYTDEQWRALRGNRIAMVFQDPLSSLNPSMRVGAQIIEALHAHGMTTASAKLRAIELLNLVRIPQAEKRFNSYPHEFSGGMRQRVVIAIALANTPSLLIADEPTTALDVTVQAAILELLRDLRDEFNLATLFITHDLGIVAEFCDEVTVMRQGKVVEKAEVERLFVNPEHAYTRLLLDAVPRIDQPSARTIPETIEEDVTPVLEVHDLQVDLGEHHWIRKSKPFFAVNGVSLRINPGETLGLVGESGCGKSTLSRAICGILPVTSGRVFINGEDVTTRHVGDASRRGVQYVFQDAYAALNPLRTVRQSLEEARVAGGSDQAFTVEELMRLVGLEKMMLERFPGTLSGGQRQRVGIARALAARPTLLLCDEPVSALDVSVQAQVIDLLEALRNELGIAILFIAHNLAVVKHLSDRVAVMYQGQIVETGPTESVYNNPQHEYTTQLLDASPVPVVGEERQQLLELRARRR